MAGRARGYPATFQYQTVALDLIIIMGKLDSFVEVLAKGLLASYLLLFAFEIHQKPVKFVSLLTNNLQAYFDAFHLHFESKEFV